MQVQARDAECLNRSRRGGSEAQNAPEQPGAAIRANQHGESAGVAKTHVGQIDDEPAGVGPEHAEELVTQRRERWQDQARR